jgi:hypothetical protein
VSGSAADALFGSSPATSTNVINGSRAAADSTTIDSSNDTLVLGMGNTTLTVTLAPGTYTPAGLAAEL